MRGFFGGAVPDILDALGLGAYKQTRESEAADTPVFGRLWRRGGDFSAQSQHLADFWEINNQLQARAQAIAMQNRDPDRVQTVPIDDPAALFAPMFEAEAKNVTFALRLANQMKESAARRTIYREAALDAKQLVDLYNQREKINGR